MEDGQFRPTPGRRVPTVTDVARRAGVSAMTVSRVINQQARVADDTRERVLVAMRELDFRPNLMAQGLASGRSRTIGVLTEDTTLWGPSAALHGIELAAGARGYAVTITHLTESGPDAVVRGANLMRSRSSEGMVLVQPRMTANGEALPAGLPPMVAIHAGMQGDYPLVGVNQGLGARMATDHLLALGHRTVHHLAGPENWYESVEREAGWRKALSDAGAEVPDPIRGDWSATSGYEAGVQLLDRSDVTAIFCANDEMALGLLHAAHERGIQCPERLSLVGFDDAPMSAFFTPSLTTIRQDFNEIGRLSVQLLIDMIESGNTNPAHIALEPTLVVRQSTAPPA
ncbi:LacI family DNA-binding transcriptional regulator [Propionicimonas sp.]|uniref:LacI family DNA-binding transcriptional regulator n=1 Tax=Propionicimonas sp. TaxID=1955623 RepID=UPI00184C77BC|nr:LacI family DNA-binding transcriptional regulator [Propionicimonas sp.]MBU3975485.1 LacI family DNA-binding transcriptional regulator [Actinomycetota bacterium]MBA3020109.1 LacI family transcriptional regulator [Propionicimonas sp.]MBU3986366.1 LacI family DNA-binding transcriptional regulator [Actinomycetota bacterium]MBU4007935.1 LacI family DNA-binding transcriptional regulator [Actinomycetota bacterium]MBU4064193.1 LacI family DNA-binding transcriptional regulator [Actinomycetota bacter